jgi:hypothetical protein
VRLYSLNITSVILPYYPAKSVYFNVNVTNKCPYLAITPMVPVDAIYTVGSAQIEIPFTNWTYAYSYCGPIKYSFAISALGAGTGYSFVSLNSTDQKFIVQTSDNS